MGLAQLLVPFLTTWFCIHVFFFLLQRFLNRPNLPVGPGSGPDYELLPTANAAGSGGGHSSSGASAKQGSSSSTGLLVKPFYVRFSTTGLNSVFFRLGNSPQLARFWRVWYGLGVCFGMLAMVLGWVLLLFAAIKLLLWAGSSLWTLSLSGTSMHNQHQPQQHTGSGQEHGAGASRFRKRDLNDGMAVTARAAPESDDSGMVLIPIIPGITFPISHLPYYLIALLVSGVIHEAGHAVAAARERTQVSSTGIFLYILYPGAFVDISPRALAIMSPLQQLRVICAGVWHNIVLFILVWAFLSSGALMLCLRVIGWTQMDHGLSVVDVDKTSDLSGHLRLGSIITKVNDLSLKGDPLDLWKTSLLPPPGPSHDNSSKKQLEAGFCIPDTLLFVKPSDCCLFTPETQFGHSRDITLSCFTPFDSSSSATTAHQEGSGDRILARDGQCLPSLDILANSTPSRCSPTDSTCAAGSTCYRPFTPYRTGSIVRLYYSLAPWMPSIEPGTDGNKHLSAAKRDQVVVYQGDPADIFEAVQVTSIGTRWSFLPLGLPTAVLLTVQYTMSFSLALSVLNIVPARHLDGHHALTAFVALFSSIQRSYKSTRSVRSSLAECLLDGGAALTAASSSLSTATFARGARFVKGVVASTTVLLGGVMIGSFLQLVVQVFWR
ncbi:Membrane-bound transcription factor site-2 protease [Mortierella alpina]|nr:Membrane-bound transcription factor site-2 protease [Mortierella alpina]